MRSLPDHRSLLGVLQLDGPSFARIVQQRELFYRQRTIRRRTRSRPRVVFEVTDGLRRIHRLISVLLREDIDRLPGCVTGYRSGYSIVNHAKPHCAKPVVAVADVSRFFASIDESRVWRLFLDLGVPPNVAMTLTTLTTHEGRLPEGTRCSPAIANLIGHELDKIILSNLPEGCVYTRYVDDLAFSGTLVPAANDVERWIAQAGFVMKPRSYVVRHRSQGPYVTGLFVGGEHPQVPRKLRRYIERALFNLAKPGNNEDRRALGSIINSVGGLDGELGKRYRERLSETAAKQLLSSQDSAIR